MMKKACELLNSDKLEIMWPVLEFITGWLQAHLQQLELKPNVDDHMRVMLDIVIYRYAFPAWCEVDVDPEDLQSEYEQVRKLH